MKIGFIGLGIMGLPMSMNLARRHRLLVWNRSAEQCRAVEALGAQVADSAREVFAACEVVILMLANDEATDAVLERGSPASRPSCVARPW